MSASDYLPDVKNALGITDSTQDSTLTVYISEVLDFLCNAGVSAGAITSGVVARGVTDLWDYGAGNGSLSDYFKMRATQLALGR